MITIIGIIMILIMGIIFVVMNSSAPKKTNATNQTNTEEKLEGVKRNQKDASTLKKDVFDFMEFDDVVDDMIVQNHKRKYSMVIQCKGINYDLMSEVEQLSIEEGFIVFLNTLKYPIQLYVQARTIDLKKSMDLYAERVKHFEDQFNEAEEDYKKKVNDFQTTDEEIAEARNTRERFANIYEYADDINRYVGRLGSNKNILQRKFYIIISYERNEINANNSFTEEEIHDICRRELYTRCQSLVSSLMSCSVVGKIMTTEQLAELLYISYNRDDARIFDIRDALDSGFYRLYSTSKDIYDKKMEKLNEEIEAEAVRRVQDAVRMTARSSRIRTPEEVEDDFEEDVDRRALNIVREADLDRETKEQLSDTIAMNHVIRAKEIADNRQAKKAREAEMLEQERKFMEEETETEAPTQEINNVVEVNEEVIPEQVSEVNIEEKTIEPQEVVSEVSATDNSENVLSGGLYSEEDDDEIL